MKAMNPSMKSAVLLFGFIASIGGSHAITPYDGPPAQGTVVLTGWLHVEDYTMDGAVLEVSINGSSHVVPVSGTGRFTMELPADVEALLRFEKPGHLAKEIVVDTRHVRDGEFSQKRSRHVKFAVILQLERHMGGLTYPGPVGSIGFDDGGGCVAVGHNRDLVPAKRHTPMVF